MVAQGIRVELLDRQQEASRVVFVVVDTLIDVLLSHVTIILHIAESHGHHRRVVVCIESQCCMMILH